MPWPGRPLASGSGARCGCASWTDLGESAWSEPLAVEAGLLDAVRLAGRLDLADGDRRARPAPGPAYRLRGEVVVDRPVRRARLHATAHGIYELELDGVRVGTDELTPGFTEYDDRTQVQTYDVTDLLAPGPHVLGALLADGWYRGQVGILRAADQWGDQTAFLAQLHLEHDDGTTTVVGTDASWRWAASHILAADLIEGQREDRRLVERAGPRRGTTPRLAAGRRQRARVRRAGLLAGPAGAARRGGPPGRRSPSCAPACTSSTSARTSTAGCG